MKSFLYTFVAAFLWSVYSFAQVQNIGGLKVGQQAPLFEAKDYKGQTVSLKKELEKGPVVLVFYRGFWCPYCNKQLSQLQDSLAFLTNLGASVITISPESDASIAKTVEKTKASFSMLHDPKGTLMNLYQTGFQLDEKTQKKYKGYGIDLEKSNAENGFTLPVPAVYVIDKKGVIQYVYFDPNYAKRTSVQNILQALQSL